MMRHRHILIDNPFGFILLLCRFSCLLSFHRNEFTCRVLSRIFCWGGGRGKSVLKKILGLLGGSESMLPGKILKYSVQDWLKWHFWTLVTFTDYLISSSNKISIILLHKIPGITSVKFLIQITYIWHTQAFLSSLYYLVYD